MKPRMTPKPRSQKPGSEASSPKAAAKKEDSTAMKLADTGYFWVGTEHKKMPYGTILTGQMFVQYFTPAEVRHPFPVILVHGLACGQRMWFHQRRKFIRSPYRHHLRSARPRV